MKLFIPKLGTKIVLTKHWKFTLIGEARNKSLWEIMTNTPLLPRPWGVPFNQHYPPKLECTLFSGAILKFDRVYIRKGAEHHNSVTFKAEIEHFGVWKKARFWVTLDDANNIEYERVQ